jgi:hypothetical protein
VMLKARFGRNPWSALVWVNRARFRRLFAAAQSTAAAKPPNLLVTLKILFQ